VPGAVGVEALLGHRGGVPAAQRTARVGDAGRVDLCAVHDVLDGEVDDDRDAGGQVAPRCRGEVDAAAALDGRVDADEAVLRGRAGYTLQAAGTSSGVRRRWRPTGY
jgi:hypothetical protein